MGRGNFILMAVLTLIEYPIRTGAVEDSVRMTPSRTDVTTQ
jgi:hypothetical protein